MRHPGKLSIKEIAEMTGGEVAGNTDTVIEGANTMAR